MTTSGIGGSFIDPAQSGGWTLGQDPTKHIGPAAQAQKKDTQVGTPMNVLLVLPEETPALHLIAGHIGFQQATPEHPVLTAAFDKFRGEIGGALADKAFEMEYENLLNALSKNLQDKFNAEMQKPLAERDPDMQSLSLALKFQAGVISLLNSFAREINSNSPILKVAEDYQSIPNKAEIASSVIASTVFGAYERYASSLGANNPGYDALINIINESRPLSNL